MEFVIDNQNYQYLSNNQLDHTQTWHGSILDPCKNLTRGQLSWQQLAMQQCLVDISLYMRFKMSVQGRLPSPIISQIKKFLNVIRGGGVNICQNFYNSKSSELSTGWGGGSNGNFSIFSVHSRGMVW